MKILLAAVPLLIAAAVLGRDEFLGPREFPFQVIVVVTFICIAARYLYGGFDASVGIVAACWVLGAGLFYASAIISKGDGVASALTRLPILGVLGYIFFDYARRNRAVSDRRPLVGGLALLFLYILLSQVGGFAIASEGVDQLVRLATAIVTILIGTSYWAFLAGRRPRWPWGRHGVKG
ncbi:MAG: hypothetical protein ACREM3_19865 [Candidatus Rokuibacteriota bacterium]